MLGIDTHESTLQISRIIALETLSLHAARTTWRALRSA